MKNSCYHCGEKYFPGHQCKLKSVIVVEKCEEEEEEEEGEQLEEPPKDQEDTITVP